MPNFSLFEALYDCVCVCICVHALKLINKFKTMFGLHVQLPEISMHVRSFSSKRCTAYYTLHIEIASQMPALAAGLEVPTRRLRTETVS